MGHQNGAGVLIAPTGLRFPASDHATVHFLLLRANGLHCQNSNFSLRQLITNYRFAEAASPQARPQPSLQAGSVFVA
jgi:hypothetical protein